MPTLEELSVDAIRTLSMDGVQKANSGHPGTPMALAPLAYVLYTRVMRHSPEDPDWGNRDRFILSAGHASMLLYSTLHLAGYDVSLEDLKRFRQLGSPTAGHPEYRDLPGIEMTTGPLGQGIAHATGFALGERMLAARFNRPGHEIIDHRTFVIASDGDMEEGVSSEAGSLAGHLGLGRLIAFYDRNHISIDGDTSISLSEDTPARYEAYGWHVQDIGEDVSLDGLQRAVDAAVAVEDRPSLIVVRTHIAQGAPNKQDTAGAHGSPLGEDEVEATKRGYDYPSLEPFFVPDEVTRDFGRAVDRGRAFVEAWREQFEVYREAHPEAAAELNRVLAGRLPEGWNADRPRHEPGEGNVATRKSAAAALEWAATAVPEVVGGSADLVASTLTKLDPGGSVERGDYAGRNIHFGIREHAMCAIVNGLTLQGFRAFGSTFLIFSDYCKPAIRLAALMQIPSIFVFTHDSVGLGEDGPTHQPIEQLWSLRATPNIDVVRPADANEATLAWEFALAKNADRPTVMALSRQGVPTLPPASVPDDAIRRGAYVLRDSFKVPEEPDLIIIGTGSEIGICLAAADLLEAEGIATRVVSAPCLDRFADQDADYRDAVLPPGCRARISVEAGATTGWHRWIGDAGVAIGMETFGASGKQPDLYKHFGFTPERVAEAGKELTQ